MHIGCPAQSCQHINLATKITHSPQGGCSRMQWSRKESARIIATRSKHLPAVSGAVAKLLRDRQYFRQAEPPSQTAS